ncbi:MAG: PSD1 domain-containing protein [Bryobacterales bacterium]|nr:PSD1 domain-containing protein [Bryobacterales bacterium]
MGLVLLLIVVPLLCAEDGTEFFETKIRPIFAGNCYGCHAQTAMGGLRLDSREAAMRGGSSGAVIVPGKAAESVLVQAVRRTHAKLKMPPAAPLKPEEVALLEKWVERGAHYPDAPSPAKVPSSSFWSFQPLGSIAAPGGKTPVEDGKTPVDGLLQAKRGNLRANPAADRSTLIRRVTLDLTGLPPTPEEVDAFLEDKSPDAFRKVVDRLLASPHFGERWARHWLDLARYSDGLLAAGVDTPLPNAYRYRDWVVSAFNKDMPYDTFVKAQIAADLLPENAREPLMGGLGFQAIANDANDQVDVTTKVFLGLTVGCAQCHDHKYDPIPTRDYYSMLGIFRSSQVHKHPLVSDADVQSYERQKKLVDEQKERIEEFLQGQQKLLVDALARRTADYVVAAWLTLQDRATEAPENLDAETLKRWVAYLKDRNKEHPYMNDLYAALEGKPSLEQVRAAAAKYQAFVLELIEESKEVDDKNYVAFGGKKGMKDERTRQYTNIVALPVLKFYQWRELASGPYNIDGFRAPAGIYYYSTKEMLRWISGFAKEHHGNLQAELKALEARVPKPYPFLHTLKDKDKPSDIKIALRGDPRNPGEIAPRGFLTALRAHPEHFNQGSGRLHLANAIASHPLTARVIVNRIWQHHFGTGIVRTPSNFGQMGERPTHPELLDYLARKLVDSGYSLKAIHREILLSDAYAMSADPNPEAAKADPDNKLYWRANARPRLDMEALRDSVLAVSGKLDRAVGGEAKPFADSNHRRSLYLTVSRTRLDATMSLFDFPDPNTTTEERPTTLGPLQGLFFLNSQFIREQSQALEARLSRECGSDAKKRMERAYRLLYARPPDAQEIELGIEYLNKGSGDWPRYLQVLLGSGEFTSVR